MNLRWLACVSVGLILFGVGCASSPVVRYYTLSARARPSTALPDAPLPRVITVGPIAMADYLNHRSVTVRSVTGTAETLVRSEFDRWGGSFRDTVIRAIVDNLAAELAPQHVVVVPWSDTASSDLALTLSINRFERSGTRVELQGAWFLTDAASRTTRAAGVLQGSAPAAGNDAVETVAAMSQALETVCHGLAEQIRKAEAASP